MDVYIECFLCKVSLSEVNTNIKQLLDHFLCSTCYDYCAPNIPASVNLTLRLPESLSPPPQQCLTHPKRLKLYCETCKVGICSKCVLHHNYHSIITIQSKLSEILSDLSNLEYSILCSQHRDPNENLARLYTEFIDKFLEFKEKNLQTMLGEAGEHVEGVYGRLRAMRQEFNGIPVKLCRKLCEVGRKVLCLLRFDHVPHYFEWNERILHVFDNENLNGETFTLPNQFVVPFYCRAVSLPFRQLMLCGGRKSAGETGLQSCYILSFDPLSIRKIQDLIVGRSNHLVVYLNDEIFVIGGLDNANKYTEVCEKYSLVTQTWSIIASVSEKKDTLCGCASFDSLYVFGGRSISMSTRIEKYNPLLNTWTILSVEMPFESSLQGCCLIPYSSQVLLFSGQNKQGEAVKNSCIIDLNSLSVVSKFEFPYKGGCVIDHPLIHRGSILCSIFTGFTHRSFFLYNITTNHWESINN